jgi:hypothetical protein
MLYIKIISLIKNTIQLIMEYNFLKLDNNKYIIKYKNITYL